MDNFQFSGLDISTLCLGVSSCSKMVPTYVVGALVPLVITLLLQKSKNEKKRGLLVDVGGEPG